MGRREHLESHGPVRLVYTVVNNTNACLKHGRRQGQTFEGVPWCLHMCCGMHVPVLMYVDMHIEASHTYTHTFKNLPDVPGLSQICNKFWISLSFPHTVWIVSFSAKILWSTIWKSCLIFSTWVQTCFDLSLQCDELCDALLGPSEAETLSKKVNTGEKGPVRSSGDVMVSIFKRRVCCGQSLRGGPWTVVKWCKLLMRATDAQFSSLISVLKRYWYLTGVHYRLVEEHLRKFLDLVCV